ncbi:MAG TPA: radical SAM protein [Symbiobacteriaceae bacterium]|nr:radical SAM protein [Symbiobacteriaceae bacterium]
MHQSDLPQITPVGPAVEVEVLVTRACNLKCPHCCAAAGSAQAHELPLADWVRILHELADAGVLTVTLTGGEPFLRDDIVEMASVAVQAGMNVAIDSNGWYVTPQVAEALSALGNVSVSISVDGPEEYHDRFRGVPGSFARAVQAVRLFSHAGVSVGVNFMVTDRSMDFFLDTARLAADAGAKSISVGQCGTLGRSDQGLVVTWKHWQEFVTRLSDRARCGELPLPIRGLWTGGWQLYLPLRHRLADAFARDVWAKPPEVTPDCGTCPLAVYTCAIGPEGEMYPCDTLTSYPEMICGSVAREGFTAVWQRSRVLHHIRSLQYRTMEPCATCDIGELCHGGCRGCTYGFTRSLSVPDPRCPRVAAHARLELGGAALHDTLPAGAPYLYPESAMADADPGRFGTESLTLFGVRCRFSKHPRSVIAKSVTPGVSYVYLNYSALSMLRNVAESAACTQAVGAIARSFGISAGRATADLTALLTQLGDGGFLPRESVAEYLSGSLRPREEDELPLFVSRALSDDRHLVLGTRAGIVRAMNATAVQVLDCIASGLDLSETVQRIALAHGADPAIVREDVQAFWATAHEFLEM